MTFHVYEPHGRDVQVSLPFVVTRAAVPHWVTSWKRYHESYRLAQRTAVRLAAMGVVGIFLELIVLAMALFVWHDADFDPVLTLGFAAFGIALTIWSIVYFIGFPAEDMESARNLAQPCANGYWNELNQDVPGLVDGRLTISFRNDRPMGYIEFRTARLDIWPPIIENDGLRLIVRDKLPDGGYQTARLSPVFMTLYDALAHINSKKVQNHPTR